jgi:AraC-like DNA-binding protein
MQHGTNVAHALEWLQRYKAVVHPDVVPRLEHRKGERDLVAFLRPISAPFAQLREPVEAQAAALVASMQVLTGRRVKPVSVALTHAAPASQKRHAEFFGCPICWSAPLLEVVFEASLLALPLPRSDPRIFGYLGRRVEELSARVERETTSNQARRAIGAALAEGEPKLADIAKLLGLSERSLHRRLQEEGLSFATLVDDARRARALLLLEDPALSMGEIAFLLGYSEPSAFFRAFRRWTGDTPRAFRQRLLTK